MNHVIRKQVIALTIDAGQDHFRVQQKASDYFYQRIAPALEKVLDDLSDETHVVTIDKMELNLGKLVWEEDHFNTSDKDIYQRLKEQVSKSLEKMMDEQNGIQTDRVNESSVEEHACRQWLTYLVQGYLPWGITATTTLWRQQVLETLATDFELAGQLKTLIRSDKNALTRLVKDHPSSFLIQLAEVLTARSQSSLPNQIGDWIIQSHRAYQIESAEQAPGALSGPVWEILLTAFATGSTDAEAFQTLETFSTDNTSPTEKKMLLPLPDDGIYITHAGLLLLHPFFKTVFGYAQLLDENHFAGRAEQEKAVMLLHFAATGRDSAEEQELVVPKIICGIPIQESLGWAPVISQLEKEDVLNMMEAAIQQWTILQNTSVDGLRESFLQRDGKLYRAVGDIRFTIEKKAIDLLLDHLPWNISIIKLPWLKELIRVDWR